MVSAIRRSKLYLAQRLKKVTVAPMMNRIASVDGLRRWPPSILLGWLILLVVVLSAAPTGGEPRTRLIGSAFDPASVSVALNRKPQTLAAHAQAGDDGERGRPEPPTMVASAAPQQRTAAPAQTIDPPREAAAAVTKVAPFPVGTQHGPRAPPAA